MIRRTLKLTRYDGTVLCASANFKEKARDKDVKRILTKLLRSYHKEEEGDKIELQP